MQIACTGFNIYVKGVKSKTLLKKVFCLRQIFSRTLLKSAFFTNELKSRKRRPLPSKWWGDYNVVIPNRGDGGGGGLSPEALPNIIPWGQSPQIDP